MAAIIIQRTTMKDLLRGVLALVVAILLSSAIGKSVSNSDSSEESDILVSESSASLEENHKQIGYVNKGDIVFRIRKMSKNSNCPVKPAKNGRRSLSKNPEEMGEFFEGDILPSKSLHHFIQRKFAFLDRRHLWHKGIVPYEIKGPFTAAEKAKIKRAMKQFHKHTCVRWKRRTKETSWVIISSDNSNGCNSHVGRQGGSQVMNLQQSKCFRRIGTIMHEMMHTLGFQHEQTRYDRDKYITVKCKNIIGGKEYNFDLITKNSGYSTYGFPYDYGSLMQYSEEAFSSNGKHTIIPKKRNKNLGQRKGFSATDIKKIRKVYRCN